jgi:replicative DNA helicase
MLDYLQLMRETSKFQSRHLEVSHIIRRVKEIAKELDVGMIVISTLARGMDDTARPSLSMLKESGDIEYAADSILFVWSPLEDDKENFISENVKVVIIDRQRHGVSYKDIKVFWIDKLTRFANYAKEEERNGKASAYAD